MNPRLPRAAVLAFALFLGAGTAAAQTPTVSSVALVSTPTVDVNGDGTAETYKPGDAVRATVTFSAAVDVAGSPVLMMRFDPSFGKKGMTFDATPGRTSVTELFFDYTVLKGDLSTQGIAFYANELIAGTEVTITAAGTTTEASLDFAKVDHDADHKVDGRAPTLTRAVIDGNILTQTYSEPLDATAKPDKSAFRVNVWPDVGFLDLADSNPVEISGNVVTLTLAKLVAADKNAETRYYKPESGVRLRDVAGNEVETTNITRATNNRQLPEFQRATVDRVTLVLTFNKVLDAGSVPAAGDFTVTANRTARGLATEDLVADPPVRPVDVKGRQVVLTLAVTVTDRQAVMVRYVQPTSGAKLQDEDGAAVASFTSQFVTNNTPPGIPPPPSDHGPPGGGAPSGTAPDFGNALVAPLVLTTGEAMTPVVLPAATGGAGALSYTLASDPAGLAELAFDAASRRLSGTPGEAGSWAFTFTAHDADSDRSLSDAAVLRFAVTVEDPRLAQVKRSVRRALAAVARRALTSALDNIGARFAASVPGSALTLAGEAVPLGAGHAAGLADRTCPSAATGRHGHDDAFGAAGEGCVMTARSRGVAAAEILRASAFSLTLGAAEGSGAPLWSVWGRGDLGSFAGRPEPGMRYEGTLRSGWLGVDARSRPWVAGLALSHGTGEADYGVGDGGVSRLETELTAFYPYGRWTLSDGLEVRGVLGAGHGEAVHRVDGGAPETSDLEMWMGSLGVRHELAPLAGIGLAAHADAGVSRLATGEGPQTVDGLTASSWRTRLGLEAWRRLALDGDMALTPFVEAAGRRDGGDGLAGTGLEVAGGVRWEAPRLQLEARGRWLAVHAQEGAEERGISVTARMGPGAHGRGLSLALSPRWGSVPAAALWRDELPQAAGLEYEAASVDARIGYGLGLAPHGLLTPFAETALAGDGRRLHLGTRFEAWPADVRVELAGARTEHDAGGTEHTLRLDLRLRF